MIAYEQIGNEFEHVNDVAVARSTGAPPKYLPPL